MSHLRIHPGAYSLIIRAVAKETGTAMTSATNAISTDPPTRASTPGFAGIDHVVPKKFHLKCHRAHQPFLSRKTMMATSSTSTIAALPASTPKNRLSARVWAGTSTRGCSSFSSPTT